MYAVGFDPGGERAFGWAVVAGVGDSLALIASGTCTGARAAFESAARHCPEEPCAFGVDAPLFWVLDGDRQADAYVRKLVCAAGGHGGTVGHVNSLRGACLVQGVQVARLAHAHWPSAAITEAHPKALLLASPEAHAVTTVMEPSLATEHERDAVAAAYAASALAADMPGWLDLVALEEQPFFPGGARVAYWFPRTGPKHLRPPDAVKRS